MAEHRWVSSLADLNLLRGQKSIPMELAPGSRLGGLALKFVRPGEKHLKESQQIRIGARRLRQFAQLVRTVHEKTGYSEKDTVQLIVGASKMRKGEAGPMSVPGRALPRIEKVMKEFERGRAAEPVKSEAARLRRRAGLPAAKVVRKAKPAPVPTPERR